MKCIKKIGSDTVFRTNDADAEIAVEHQGYKYATRKEWKDGGSHYGVVNAKTIKRGVSYE